MYVYITQIQLQMASSIVLTRFRRSLLLDRPLSSVSATSRKQVDTDEEHNTLRLVLHYDCFASLVKLVSKDGVCYEPDGSYAIVVSVLYASIDGYDIISSEHKVCNVLASKLVKR